MVQCCVTLLWYQFIVVALFGRKYAHSNHAFSFFCGQPVTFINYAYVPCAQPQPYAWMPLIEILSGLLIVHIGTMAFSNPRQFYAWKQMSIYIYIHTYICRNKTFRLPALQLERHLHHSCTSFSGVWFITRQRCSFCSVQLAHTIQTVIVTSTGVCESWPFWQSWAFAWVSVCMFTGCLLKQFSDVAQTQGRHQQLKR